MDQPLLVLCLAMCSSVFIVCALCYLQWQYGVDNLSWEECVMGSTFATFQILLLNQLVQTQYKQYNQPQSLWKKAQVFRRTNRA